MISVRIPDPDALWADYIQISVLIEFHAVGDAIIFSAGFLAEDSAIGECAVGVCVVNPNVSLFAIVDIKVLAIWRESQTVRLSQILCEQFQVTFAVEPVHALVWNLLFRS